MTLGRLILLGAWRLKRRYVGLVVLLVLGGALVTVGAALGSYAGNEATTAVDRGSSLRTITVSGTGQPLTQEAIRSIRELPGVTSATEVLSVPVGLKRTASSLNLVGWNEATRPPLVGSRLTDRLGPRQVFLPATADGVDLQPFLGKTVQLTYTVAVSESAGTTKEIALKVVGFTDPSYQVDGPLAAYASSETVSSLAAVRAGLSPEAFRRDFGYDRVVVVAASEKQVAPVLKQIQGSGYQAVSALQELEAVPGVITLIRLVTAVLFAALLAVGLLAVVALTQNMCLQRASDIAIFKAYGWPSRRIQSVLTGETAMVCGLSMAMGVALGLLAAPGVSGRLRDALADAPLGRIDLPITQILTGAFATLLLLLVGVWLAVAKVNRASVIDILRTS